MAPDPRMLRAQRYPLHSAVASGDLARTQGLLDSQAGCQINRKYENAVKLLYTLLPALDVQP